MTGIILSGGKNARMGENKAFIRVDGERIIDRTIRIFRELFDEISGSLTGRYGSSGSCLMRSSSLPTNPSHTSSSI
ncbi:MAG: NTP transferase domain-containing protein [Deltaproteobacteria bacterium]|nr:NTP transferase domain-containing protein [Deltaproteobacteria bacterium]